MTMMIAAQPRRMCLIGLLAVALTGCRDDASRPRSETSLITTTGLDSQGRQPRYGRSENRHVLQPSPHDRAVRYHGRRH